MHVRYDDVLDYCSRKRLSNLTSLSVFIFLSLNPFILDLKHSPDSRIFFNKSVTAEPQLKSNSPSLVLQGVDSFLQTGTSWLYVGGRTNWYRSDSCCH